MAAIAALSLLLLLLAAWERPRLQLHAAAGGDPDRELVGLAGPWRMKPVDVAPEVALAEGIDSWTEARVPGYTPLPSPRPDVVWFGLDVELPEPEHERAARRPLAVLLPPFLMAYEVYASGEPLGQAGSPPPRLVATPVRSTVFDVPEHLTRTSRRLELRVRVWTMGGIGGLVGSHSAVDDAGVLIGERALVRERAEVLLAAQLHMFSADLVFGIISLAFGALLFLIYFYAERSPVMLYAALALGFVGVGSLLHTYALSGHAASFHPLSALAGYFNFLTLLSLTLFVGHLFALTGRLHRVAVAFTGATTLLASAILISSPLEFAILPALRLLVVLALAYVVFAVVRAARRGSPDGKVMAAGIGVMACALIAHGVLNIVDSRLVGPLSFYKSVAGLASQWSFMAMLGIVVAQRLARSVRDLERSHAASQRFVPHTFLGLLGRKNVTELERADAAALPMGILFADIRDFTSRSQKKSPAEMFQFINRYLEVMEPCILGEGGFIHQYLGDGIVALFPQGGAAAARAAVSMRQAARSLNRELVERSEDPLQIGIGVHAGPVMLGTIGGLEQLDTGVISDHVNLCARIEGLTKMYDVGLLVTGAVAAELPAAEAASARELDRVIVKGRTEPVTIFEILEQPVDPGAAGADARAAVDARHAAYREALAAYRAGDFLGALEKFSACAGGAAALLAERCKAYAASPPEGWDGVHVLTQK